MNISTSELRPRLAGAAGPILVFGFGTAVAMWCAWFLVHLPGLGVSPQFTGGVLLAAIIVGTVAAGWTAGHSGWLVGLGTGAVSSILSILVLGSKLVVQPAPDEVAPGFTGLPPSALAVIPAFIALGAVIGLIGGAAGSLVRRLSRADTHPPTNWLARFALVTAISIVPVLLVGGVVTSTKSGLAVPDWPGTFGANMFLYPISELTRPRVFYEHAHRLFGALVGLTTLTLMFWVFRARAGRAVTAWAIALFTLVCIQGLLGWLRVEEKKAYFGLIHGVLAQLIFALAAALAAWLSPTYAHTAPIDPDPRDRRRKAFATALLHTSILQLILGAAFRHLRRIESPGALHTLWTHAAFALIVVIFAVAVGFALIARRNAGSLEPTLRRTGRALVAIVALQFILGWTAALLILSSSDRTPVPEAHEVASSAPVPWPEALIATAHQANGALLLATAALAFTWTRRLRARTTPG